MSKWSEELMKRHARANYISRLYKSTFRESLSGDKWAEADEFRRRIDEVVTEFEPSWQRTEAEEEEYRRAINAW